LRNSLRKLAPKIWPLHRKPDNQTLLLPLMLSQLRRLLINIEIDKDRNQES
jgi:hypothetical protein